MTIPLILGILSSWHCLGMCGPLFTALLFTDKNNKFSFLNFLIYQFSRVFIYALMGLLPVIIGLTSVPVQFQQIISIVCGVLMLIFIWFSYSGKSKISDKISMLVKKINAKGLKIKNSVRYFFLGAANGILPCGMVYIALTASIGNIQQMHPSVFMMIFGLATIPVFFVLFIIRKTVFGNSILKSIFKAKPIILTAIAILLILRGLNLNIPLISPQTSKTNGVTKISCCHDPRK